jgi:hypothetical protein
MQMCSGSSSVRHVAKITIIPMRDVCSNQFALTAAQGMRRPKEGLSQQCQWFGSVRIMCQKPADTGEIIIEINMRHVYRLKANINQNRTVVFQIHAI